MNVPICNIIDGSCMRKMINVIRNGGVVVYPTDTVYGLGGDPFDINVVNRITHLKSRHVSPYPILVGDKEHAFKLFEYSDELLNNLINSFWPGSLTIISRSRIGIPANFFRKKIGLRMPNNRKLLNIINQISGFLIGTSANISGYPPSHNISMAIKYFGDNVDLYVDGGESANISSTVVEIICKKIIVKRIGKVSRDDLESFCNVNRCIIV